MTNFTFTNKAEYLQFRAQWKADYQAASLEQREAKKNYNEAMRLLNSPPSGLSWNQIRIKLDTAYNSIISNKSDQNQRLEDLKKAKVRAAEQYLANKKSGESV